MRIWNGKKREEEERGKKRKRKEKKEERKERGKKGEKKKNLKKEGIKKKMPKRMMLSAYANPSNAMTISEPVGHLFALLPSIRAMPIFYLILT